MATAIRAERAADACRWPTLESFEDTRRAATRAATDVRHTAEDAAAEASLAIRRHPLRSVAVALAAGALCGAVAGFTAGWLARQRV